MSSIKGLTKEQTKHFLAKAQALIELKPGEIKFRKSRCKNGLSEADLDFSIVKDENGNYFALGDRKTTDLLGSGSFAEVRSVYPLIWKDGQLTLGGEVVVKKGMGNFEDTNKDKYERLQEFEDDAASKQTRSNWKGQNKIYMFTKVVEGKELLNAFNDGDFARASALKRLDFILSIIPQLVDLHESKRVAHRDIKPQNIMYSPSTNKGKIIDFDFATPIGKAQDGLTPLYAAPELVSYLPKTAIPATDIYAIGIVFAQLFQCNPSTRKYANKDEFLYNSPVFNQKFIEFKKFSKQDDFLKTDAVVNITPHLFECPIHPDDGYNFPKNLVDFLKSMVHSDATQRPSARQVQDFFVSFRAKYAEVQAPLDERKKQAREIVLQSMNFNIHLNGFITKAKIMAKKAEIDPNYVVAAKRTQKLCDDLSSAQSAYLFDNSTDGEEALKDRFKQVCTSIMDDVKPVLEPHREWKGAIAKFLVDVLSIITFGLTTKLGLFAKTDSVNRLDKFAQEINNTSDVEISP